MSKVHDFEKEAERRMRAVEALDTSDLSDDTMANRLSAERFRGDWLYVHRWREWMQWTGARWEVDDRLQHRTIVRQHLKDYANATKGKEADELRSAKKAYAVEQMVRSNPEVAAGADQWDSDPWLLGTPGGTVDLRTGQLRDARRDEHITKLTAATPADTADCPQWQAFLQRIFRSEPDIVPFMQRLAGYALTGMTSEHKLLFAFGEGRNGKGTFFDTLADILQDYSQVSSTATFLESGMSDHPTGLASLAGARLVTASELPSNKKWDDELLKSLTGGDPITARRMRQDFFTYQPQFTLTIFGNHMPRLGGVDEAMRSRMVLIPFKETIPPEERVPDMKGALKDEWPGILRWAIEGALEWQDTGLCPPPAVDAASEQYLDDEDTLGQFVTECLDQDASASAKSSHVYAAFRDWTEAQGMKPWSQKALSQAMIERGFKRQAKRDGKVWLGYRVNTCTSSSYAYATRGV